jgi:aspartate kinase
VLVVSAMGRNGAPYATDTLLSVGQSCGARLRKREHDLIASCGETISAVVMAQSLLAKGILATPLTGAQAGIITDGEFGNSRVRQVNTKMLWGLIEDGRVPVIAGFQGVSEAGEITTLGRGGSDTTACIIGAALNAHSVEIFTDVDGVMTADPRIVSNAQLIPEADYSEIRALAQNGSKIIVAQALEVAAQAEIPLVVRSTAGSSEGTLVHFKKHGTPVTGVTSFSNITFFRIAPEREKQYASNLHAFRMIAEARISVHFIDIRPHEITFVVESHWTEAVADLLESNCYKFETDEDFAKVSVIGVGMTGQPGMMATIIDALSQQDIPIYQSTDAQTSISCLVRKEHEQKALRLLHDAFGLGEPRD